MMPASVAKSNMVLVPKIRDPKKSLLMFARASGQRVGPAKSKLWFSKVTPQAMQLYIRQLFQAPLTMSKEVYLGVLLIAKRKGDFQELMNRLATRLNG
jgi:hypothetical protein